ncbi:MAG: Na/Pi cotransporter family protein [Ktedonobacteraceae bacterium]
MFDTTNPTAILGLIFGGVLMLLYGVQLITHAMQRDAGARLRRSLVVLTKHPLAAFGVGMGITMLTQSSGATSSLLVGLVSVGMLELRVAIITLLGTGVGSALIVQLLIFHITAYAFVFVGLGALIAMLTHHSQRRGLGQACFGFGLVILGLAALEAGSRPLADSHMIALVFDSLVTSPVVLVLLGIALTMVFASSIAGIGLIFVLASNGSLPLVAALALMLGSNIGSTVTAMLTALSRGSVVGRRLALIHTGTKLAVALTALAFLGPLTTALSWVHLPPASLVALSHLGFNLILALIFVPLAGSLAAWMEKLVPERNTQGTTGPRYLHPDALSMPAVALGQATREILHMTDLVTEMLNVSIPVLEEGGSEVLARVDVLDDQLDELNTAVKRYLTQLNEEQMTEAQRNRQIALLYIITDLEEMGDLIDKHWMRLARRKRRKQIVFSDEGWQDLLSYHREVAAAAQLAFAAVAAQDRQLATAFFARKAQLSQMKRQLHLRHIRRLQSGMPHSVESSAIHLDLLNAMRGILAHASTIAHVVQEDLSVEEGEEVKQGYSVQGGHTQQEET